MTPRSWLAKAIIIAAAIEFVIIAAFVILVLIKT